MLLILWTILRLGLFYSKPLPENDSAITYLSYFGRMATSSFLAFFGLKVDLLRNEGAIKVAAFFTATGLLLALALYGIIPPLDLIFKRSLLIQHCLIVGLLSIDWFKVQYPRFFNSNFFYGPIFSIFWISYIFLFISLPRASISYLMDLNFSFTLCGLNCQSIISKLVPRPIYELILSRANSPFLFPFLYTFTFLFTYSILYSCSFSRSNGIF